MSEVLLNTVLRACTLLGKFSFVVLLANLVSPQQFGLYSLAVALVTFSVYFVGLEFHTFVSRQVAKSSKLDWHSLFGRGLTFVVASFVALLPATGAIFIFGGLSLALVPLALGVLLVELVAATMNWLLIASGLPLRASVVLMMRSVGWSAIYLGAYFLVPGLGNAQALLVVWLIGGLGTCVLAWRMLPARPSMVLDWSEYATWVRTGLRHALPMLIAIMAVRAVFTADKVIIEMMFGLTILAAYAFYGGIGNAVMSLVDSSVLVFYFSRVIREATAADGVALRKSFVEMLIKCTVIAAVLCLSAWLCVGILVQWMQHDIYADNIDLLNYTLLSAFIFSLGIAPNHLLFAAGRRRTLAIINMMALSVFLVLVSSVDPDNGASAILVSLCYALASSFLMKSAYAGAIIAAYSKTVDHPPGAI